MVANKPNYHWKPENQLFKPHYGPLYEFMNTLGYCYEPEIITPPPSTLIGLEKNAGFLLVELHLRTGRYKKKVDVCPSASDFNGLTLLRFLDPI